MSLKGREKGFEESWQGLRDTWKGFRSSRGAFLGVKEIGFKITWAKMRL